MYPFALQCSLAIVTRAASGRKLFTKGSDEWTVTVKGVGGRAAGERTGYAAYPDSAPITLSDVKW